MPNYRFESRKMAIVGQSEEEVIDSGAGSFADDHSAIAQAEGLYQAARSPLGSPPFPDVMRVIRADTEKLVAVIDAIGAHPIE